MKRLFPIFNLFLSVLVSFSLYAQEETSPFKFHRDNYYRHEFGVSNGFASDYEIHNNFKDFRKKICHLYQIQEKPERDQPLIEFVGINGYYLYNLSDRMSIGMLFGVNYGKYWLEREIPEYANNYLETNPMENAGHVSCRLWYGLPIVRYIWFDNSKFCFYSKVGFGLCWQRLHYSGEMAIGIAPSQKSSNEMAFHVCPIGILFSAGRFRFFAEGGYNTSGIVNIGVSVNLDKVRNLHP